MAFDTLARWHEQAHVNPAGFHITPAVRYPIPRYSPWPALAAGLANIAPQFDPLTIATRRLAMQKIPLEQGQIALAQQQLPIEQQKIALQSQYQLPMMRAYYQAMTKAYQNGQINPATGKPFTQSDIDKLNNRKRAMDSWDRYNDFDKMDQQQQAQPSASTDLNSNQPITVTPEQLIPSVNLDQPIDLSQNG